MSAIDQVIARSRQPGTFSERKTFTVARRRALRKLRNFALADPHHYILELIQAAVANGAEYIDIAVAEEEVTLSYVGGGLAEAELAQIFDFLFASKERAELGHMRELALGLNALLLFEPARVVVESGDGTLEGTTRLVIHGRHDQVDVGRPDAPLKGTFLRAIDLRRAAALGRKGWLSDGGDGSLEARAVEERCLATPVPIFVNGEPVSGYSRRRTPVLYGYQRTRSFDEGDLYGSIGLAGGKFEPSFTLLTYGVRIHSLVHTLLPGQRLGGIVCFDRLHKTVDHASIVRDGRLEELWLRLRPYAEELVSGRRATAGHEVRLLGGQSVPTRKLRGWLQTKRRAVLVDPETDPAKRTGLLAAGIGRALEAPVILADEAVGESLGRLAGPAIGMLRPDLARVRDLSFYLQPPSLAPHGPWLVPPAKLPPLTLEDLAAALGGGDEEPGDPDPGVAAVRRALVGNGRVFATVFTPNSAEAGQEGLPIELVTADRVVYACTLPAAVPGHRLRVVLPDLAPELLLARIDPRCGLARHAAAWIAAELSHRVAPLLQESTGKALAALVDRPPTPDSAQAHLALAELARVALPLLQRDGARAGGGVGLRLALSGPSRERGVLELPLLRRACGTATSLSEVLDEARERWGLVHVCSQAPRPGLSAAEGASRGVLRAGPEQLRRLRLLLGDATLVSQDEGPPLAHTDGLVCVAVAPGLRPYPEFPLLVEGGDPSSWDVGSRRRALVELLRQLARLLVGVGPEAAEPGPQLVSDGRRRHAARHLQWFVCRQAALGEEGDLLGLGALPLFVDLAGRARSLDEVLPALRRPGGLRVQHLLSFGRAELDALAEAARARRRRLGSDPPGLPEPAGLLADPFLVRLVEPLGSLQLGFDAQPSVAAAEGPEGPSPGSDTLASRTVAEAGVHGWPCRPRPPSQRSRC